MTVTRLLNPGGAHASPIAAQRGSHDVWVARHYRRPASSQRSILASEHRAVATTEDVRRESPVEDHRREQVAGGWWRR